MTMDISGASRRSGGLLRSFVAVLAGFVVILVLSIGTDQIFHLLEVYPPWGEPMHETDLNLLALTYRIVYAVIGSYLAARLAPRAPMGHALALGVIGLALSIAGAVAMWGMSPGWFMIALVAIALPCAWLGGVLHRLWNADGASRG